ncbi:heavy metal-binding domain-containing protein, partial [Flavobacterium alvei]|uniref:heavy metal-binding domain-containing protein n=1 Tax=Flavobacterium alvei TaxID=2080416 RepID=UPI0026F091A2
CSKCGTGMVKIAETVDNHPQKGSQPKTKIVTKYVCPMDGTTADIKGECPKCGMDMIEKKI